MAEKKQLMIRIPYALWEELNQMAEDEMRSLNAQIEYMLTKAVRNKKTKAHIVAEELVDALSYGEETENTFQSERLQRGKINL